MNLRLVETKVFAFIFLFFVSLISVGAQDDSSVYRIPAGTILSVQMDNEINSEISSEKDTFTATLARPLIRRETLVLPVGTVLEGRVTRAEPAATGGRNGKLEVVFQTLRLTGSGASRRIEGELVKPLEAESSQTFNALAVIGATAAGGIIGALTKVKNGALFGSGIGAGTGAGIALLRKGKNISIKADEMFEVKLTKEVVLPVRDF